MGGYQTFLDGVALGFFLGFIAFYLLYRYMASKRKKPKTEVDHLVDDIQDYYRNVSDPEGKDYD